MAALFDPTKQLASGLGPDDLYSAQQKLALAGALQKQSDQPQGQMVSGIYVAPNPLQRVSALVNQLYGAQLQGDALGGLAQAKQAQTDQLFGGGAPSSQALANGLGEGATMSGSAMGGSPVDNTGYASSFAGRSGLPQSQAMMAYQLDPEGFTKQLLSNSAPTDAIKTAGWQGISGADSGAMARAAAAKDGGLPGSVITAGPNGMPVYSMAPGALDVAGAMSRAQASGPASYRPQTYTAPNGQAYLSNDAAMASGNPMGGVQSPNAPVTVPATPPMQPPQGMQSSPAVQTLANDPTIMNAVGGGIAPVQSDADKTYNTDRAKANAGMIDTINTQAGEAQGMRQNIGLMRMADQDPDVLSGGLADNIKGVQQLGSSLGIDTKGQTANQVISAVGNKMTLQVKNAGGQNSMPGAMSDADRNFLASTSPNLNNTKEGRSALYNIYDRVAQRQIDYANLADTYRQQHGRLDDGFQSYARQYFADKPLFNQQDLGVSASAGKTKTLKNGQTAYQHSDGQWYDGPENN